MTDIKALESDLNAKLDAATKALRTRGFAAKLAAADRAQQKLAVARKLKPGTHARYLRRVENAMERCIKEYDRLSWELTVARANEPDSITAFKVEDLRIKSRTPHR
jgi:hypothetical protein